VQKNIINILLQEDMKVLDEVVAVGYGEQKRSDLSGAMSVVKSGRHAKPKHKLRMDQALQGLAAGVNVTRTGGAPWCASHDLTSVVLAPLEERNLCGLLMELKWIPEIILMSTMLNPLKY